jgi:phospholipid transport system transporter-binding protein
MADAALPTRLNLQTASQALLLLSRSLEQPGGSVVKLDAQALESFDSSAIAVLLELRRQLLSQGKTLQVTGWPPRLRDLVALYGVGELLPA